MGFAELFALLGFGGGAVYATDWPELLGPTRNGVYDGPDLAEAWPKGGPPIVWRKTVGQGFSGPVVSAGKLILFHRKSNKEVVDCFDAQKGERLWSVDYPTAYRDDFGFDEGPRATPTIAGQHVFTFGAEGMLQCLELATGKKVWSVDTKAAFQADKGFFGMACSPLAEGSVVIVNIGGRNGAGIAAFDRTTGKVIWKATDDEASCSSPTAAAINGSPCALVLTRSELVALDPANGRIRFQYPFRPPMQASVTAATPLVIDDLIFISASYGTGAALLQVQGDAVKKLWAADDILSNHYATSVHRENFLYGFDGRQEQGCNLRCVELRGGKVRWSQDGFGAGTLIMAKGDLLILTEKGELVRAPATPAGFKPAGKAQILSFQVRAHPALADGFLYARSKDQLVCVDLGKRN
jgi:outer membrane protein assembly factor BamB